MRRTQLAEEPYSRAALWAPRVAWFALAVAALAAGASRFGGLEPVAALSVLAAAFILAGVAILSAIAAYGAIWRHGLRGVRSATLGLVLAAALLSPSIFISLQAARLPAATDISTDALDPPDFARSARALAARHGRAPPGELATQRQAAVDRAYPELHPITVDLDLDQAFKLVDKVAARLRWAPVEQRPPGGRLGLGHLDYVDRSLIFGFPSDVAVRLTPLVGQTRIDLRSVARVGAHDVGEGARRFRKFAEAIEEETAAD